MVKKLLLVGEYTSGGIYDDIFIMCISSAHLPVSQILLKKDLSDEIGVELVNPPYYINVNNLEVLCTVLSTPLHFLYFVSQRLFYDKQMISDDEFCTLNMHLVAGLKSMFNASSNNFVLIDAYNNSQTLDQIYYHRKNRIPLQKFPETILDSTPPWHNIIQHIQYSKDSEVLKLGFHLLSISKSSINNISKKYKKACALVLSDKKSRAMILIDDDNKCGISLFCSASEKIDDSIRKKAQYKANQRKCSSQAEIIYIIYLCALNDVGLIDIEAV